MGFKDLGPLHNEWIRDMVLGDEDESLQASRGTYKTSCVSIALALIIILLPGKRILFLRKTDGDVKEIIKQVKKILIDPHTQYIVTQIYGVPISFTTDTANEISTNLAVGVRGTSQLVGGGINSSLTGKHFDFIFTDDIVNIKDRQSKAERDNTKLMYQELQNVKNRGGKIFNTLTPWHPDDAASIMPSAKKYNCYHPEIAKIISAEELAEIKTKMAPSLFAANYELQFVAAEDVMFTSPVFEGKISNVEQGTCHIDAAYGGEDYTALTILKKGTDEEGHVKYYVYGRLWRRHIDDVMHYLIADIERLNAGRIFVEDNGDKGYLAKALRKMGQRVTTYHEHQNKFLKISSYLMAIWKDVVFVEGTDQLYINQICDYTEDAEHDDAPDSLASLARFFWARSEANKGSGKSKGFGFGGLKPGDFKGGWEG